MCFREGGWERYMGLEENLFGEDNIFLVKGKQCGSEMEVSGRFELIGSW